jgi:hypothetical protein
MRPMVTLPVRQISSFPMGPCGRAAVRDTALRCPPPAAPTPTPTHPTSPPEAPAAPRTWLVHQHRTKAARRAACSAREARSTGFQSRSIEMVFTIDSDPPALYRDLHRRTVGGGLRAEDPLSDHCEVTWCDKVAPEHIRELDRTCPDCSV